MNNYIGHDNRLAARNMLSFTSDSFRTDSLTLYQHTQESLGKKQQISGNNDNDYTILSPNTVNFRKSQEEPT